MATSTQQAIKALLESNPESYGDFISSLEGERAYQEKVWNESTTDTSGIHSLAEWSVFIYEYTNEARAHMSRQPEPHAVNMAADCLRKVAAMVLAAAEQQGFVDLLCESTNKNVLTEIRSVNELLCYLQYPINKISEHYYSGGNGNSLSIQFMLVQIFIAIMDTVSKTNSVVYREELNLEDIANLIDSDS